MLCCLDTEFLIYRRGYLYHRHRARLHSYLWHYALSIMGICTPLYTAPSIDKMSIRHHPLAVPSYFPSNSPVVRAHNRLWHIPHSNREGASDRIWTSKIKKMQCIDAAIQCELVEP